MHLSNNQITGDTPPDLRWAKMVLLTAEGCNDHADSIPGLGPRVRDNNMICTGYLNGHIAACYVS